MANNLLLPQTDFKLPLIDQELIYADVGTILYKSKDQKSIVDSLSNKDKELVQFYTSSNSEGVYPRFDVNDYIYKVKPDTDICTMIDLNHTYSYDFFDLTDTKSLELMNLSINYDKVFIFWSGGIDSTIILAAILKNWTKEFLKKIVVVCNKYSIDEHPKFYKKFIENKLQTVNSDLFYKDQLKFKKDSMYVSCATADLVIGYGVIEDFDNHFPNIYNNSYKKHSKEIIKYFGNDKSAYFSYAHVLKSIEKNKLKIETVYDFLWWIDFNWSFDLNVYYILWHYSLLTEDINPREFLTKNNFDWFADQRYQYWAIQAIGTNLKIRDNIKSFKYIYKKYIYDFDNDLDYFLYKTKERSFPKNENIHHGKKLVAIDKDWNLYYR